MCLRPLWLEIAFPRLTMSSEDPEARIEMDEAHNRQLVSHLEEKFNGLIDNMKEFLVNLGQLKDKLKPSTPGQGNINATENEGHNDLENAADTEEQRNLAAPVLDELHKANSYFMTCLFLVGTILVGGVGAAAVPCGYKAISLPVSVVVVMLIFCGTHIWKMQIIRKEDPRRAPLLKKLGRPFMVDMVTAVVGALFFLIMFGVSSIMKNCGVEDPPGVPGPPPPGLPGPPPPQWTSNSHNLAESI